MLQQKGQKICNISSQPQSLRIFIMQQEKSLKMSRGFSHPRRGLWFVVVHSIIIYNPLFLVAWLLPPMNPGRVNQWYISINGRELFRMRKAKASHLFCFSFVTRFRAPILNAIFAISVLTTQDEASSKCRDWRGGRVHRSILGPSHSSSGHEEILLSNSPMGISRGRPMKIFRLNTWS